MWVSSPLTDDRYRVILYLMNDDYRDLYFLISCGIGAFIVILAFGIYIEVFIG